VSRKRDIVILHGEVPEDAPPDEQDVLHVAQDVAAALERLGYRPVPVVFSLNIAETLAHIRRVKPYVVFNLVDSVNGRNRMASFAPGVLETERIPFTGGNESATFTTTNKLLAKQIMRLSGIDTPSWQRLDEIGDDGLNVPLPLIIKPWGEDASMGIDDDSVCATAGECGAKLRKIPVAERSTWFAEGFIAGREFNVSLLAKENGVEIMPPAEMLFRDFPPEKPQIVNYRAKWDETAFEYINTVRTFTFAAHDAVLLDQVRDVSRRCWRIFNCTGYVRVDLRVDGQGRPWVIELNSNPCISPEGGFISACAEGGWGYDDVIECIVADAARRSSLHKGGNA
jgi:D-alanine-D-alanine ligase